jgi:hypothetical protein
LQRFGHYFIAHVMEALRQKDQVDYIFAPGRAQAGFPEQNLAADKHVPFSHFIPLYDYPVIIIQ